MAIQRYDIKRNGGVDLEDALVPYEFGQLVETEGCERELAVKETEITLLKDRIKREEGRQNSERGREAKEMLKLEAENASLKAQMGRLSAPVSDEEKDRLNAATNYSMGDTWCRLFPYIDALLAARAAKKPCGCLSDKRPCAKASGLDMKNWYCEAEANRWGF